jgi:hypothetical protein
VKSPATPKRIQQRELPPWWARSQWDAGGTLQRMTVESDRGRGSAGVRKVDESDNNRRRDAGPWGHKLPVQNGCECCGMERRSVSAGRTKHTVFGVPVTSPVVMVSMRQELRWKALRADLDRVGLIA